MKTKPWTIVDDKTGRFVRQQPVQAQICPCGKEFNTTPGRKLDGRGKYCSKACMYEFRPRKSIKPGAKYSAVHKWMAKEFGQNMECEHCSLKSDNPYQIHWANLDGEYSRDRNTWARLCAKCHWHLDRDGVL